MHVSKFLEEVDASDPRRSEYRIVLVDGQGNEVDSISDISGVSYVTDLFLDLKDVVAGEKEIVDGVEDNELSSSDVVSQAAKEYHDKERDEQQADEPGQRAADADESLDRVVNTAVDEVEQRIREFETRKKA